MSELTDSFKPVDPEAWEAAEKAAKLLNDHFWRGHVLWDVNGNPITDVGQLTACLVAGTWPRAEALAREGAFQERLETIKAEFEREALEAEVTGERDAVAFLEARLKLDVSINEALTARNGGQP